MVKRIAAAVFVALGVAVLQAPVAQARDCAMGYWCTYLWYADSSHAGGAVGGRYVECDGYRFEWGNTATPWMTFDEQPCL